MSRARPTVRRDDAASAIAVRPRCGERERNEIRITALIVSFFRQRARPVPRRPCAVAVRPARVSALGSRRAPTRAERSVRCNDGTTHTTHTRHDTHAPWHTAAGPRTPRTHKDTDYSILASTDTPRTRRTPPRRPQWSSHMRHVVHVMFIIVTPRHGPRHCASRRTAASPLVHASPHGKREASREQRRESSVERARHARVGGSGPASDPVCLAQLAR